jgi:hypothetical protein
MLTGEGTHDIAMTAFNQKLIDKYIEKQNPDLPQLLLDAIYEMQAEAFLELSESTLSLIRNRPGMLGCLGDPVFVKLFARTQKKTQAVEHYLLDAHGSFLFLDAFGTASILAVKNKDELDTLYEYAESESAPTPVVNALKNREKVPFFYSDEDLQTPPAKWEKYLHPAEHLVGQEPYYYSLITDLEAHHIKLDKFLPYKKYLDKISRF